VINKPALTLLEIPIEILYLIASNLSLGSTTSLLRTNKYFQTLLSPLVKQAGNAAELDERMLAISRALEELPPIYSGRFSTQRLLKSFGKASSRSLVQVVRAEGAGGEWSGW
jgi:hypothetical protein